MDQNTLQTDIPFTKMSGTGNDFIIIDHRNAMIKPEDQAEFARLICRRKFSVGADGLILIENAEQEDFRWQFYNADGSAAEMCGNGARCAARFAHAKGIAPANMRFMTKAGVIEAAMVDQAVRIKLTVPEDLVLEQQALLDGQPTPISSLNTGVPHVVCFVDDISQAKVDDWGRIIRFDQQFAPAGTNVNFVQAFADNSLHVRTYERGVEAETLACGTGAVASAIIAALKDKVQSPVSVTTSGGEKLSILFNLDQANGTAQEVFLEGPANFIYNGILSAEALH